MKKLSTLFFGIILSGAASAQIPNPGFENWTAHTGYNTPDGWANLDSIGALNPGTPVYPCVQGSPGYAGAHYVQLTSKTTVLGVVPGIAVAGKISVSGTSFALKSGFAISTRPQKLTGAWQYMASGTDQGNIAVLLTKWNTTTSKRDTISYTNTALSGMVMAWTTFSVTLTYNSGAVPDSGIILLASGKATGGTDGSYLYVDTLGFAGTVPAGVVTVNNAIPQISIFPNPASIYTNVAYDSKSSGTVKICIADISGKTIKESNFNKVAGENNFPLDVSNISGGIYFVRMTDEEGVSVRKLIIQ